MSFDFVSAPDIFAQAKCPAMAAWSIALDKTIDQSPDHDPAQQVKFERGSISSRIPESKVLGFAALRNGKRLGEHIVTFDVRETTIIADIAIDYIFKIGFITAFRYKLRAREIWSLGQLQTVRSKTDHNGNAEFMNANRDDQGLLIEGSKVQAYRAAPGSIIASHWNVAQLNAPMINPQDGTRLPYTVTAPGTTLISVSAGTSKQARHFALSGENPLDLWYDMNDIWCGLRAKVFDGSVVTYLQIR